MAYGNRDISSKSWAMIGGDGPRSYFQNSFFQKAVVDAAKGMIREGIEDQLDFKDPCFDALSTFRVVDFGCSVGTNSFLALENIIDAVKEKHHSQFQDSAPLEFLIFFNDVTSNDFNTLFRNLSEDPKYFSAGVPGSFYGRLFPKYTIHFAHSSYALHWLSKIPKEVVNSKSPAWNKDSIYCSGSRKEVVKAYSDQFRHDMDSFLNSRAQEIVHGGLMAIVIIGLPEGVHMFQTRMGIFYDLFGSCLKDMVKQGLLGEEQVDLLNLPMYYPYVKEVEETINLNGYFGIERINTFSVPLSRMKPSVEAMVSTSRAMTGDHLKLHFGDDAAVDQTYECLAKKLSENYFIFDEAKHHTDIFMLLKRHVD